MKGAALALAATVTMALGMTGGASRAGEPDGELVVFAAGSLRAPLTEIGRQFEEREPGARLRFVFGASGLQQEVHALQRVDLPEDVNDSADYGVALLERAGPRGRRFVEFVLGPVGAAALTRQGFTAR